MATLGKKSWDMGLDYEEIRKRILDEVSRVRNRDNMNSLTRLAYPITYAIQLRNGSRISEAVEGFNRFLNNEFSSKKSMKVIEVRVRKKRQHDTRILIYPGSILFNLVDKLRKYRVDVKTNRAKTYCSRLLGVNTHPLRYARITYLLNKGVNPSIAAKITHHSKLTSY